MFIEGEFRVSWMIWAYPIERKTVLLDTQSRSRYTCTTTLLTNDFQFIMDVEKYFILANESMSTNRAFYTSDLSIMPSDVKFKRTEKYCTKVLLWIPISENRISKQTQPINEITYFKDCIQARVISFINTYDNKQNVLFWADLATSHYAESVINSKISMSCLQKKIVRIVSKCHRWKRFGKLLKRRFMVVVGKAKRSTS